MTRAVVAPARLIYFGAAATKALELEAPPDSLTDAALSFGQVWEKERVASPPSVPDRLAAAARAATRESHRKQQRGELVPLGINPATGKRFNATGRYPTTGFYSPMLPQDEPSPQREPACRWRSRRERANELRSRMATFSAIYNAGYMVRNYYFGPDARQHEAVMKLIAVLLQDLRSTSDHVACLFALADALYCSPNGVPWDS